MWQTCLLVIFLIRGHLHIELWYNQDGIIQNSATDVREFFKTAPYSLIMLPHDLEVRYSWYRNSRAHFSRPKILKMMKSLCFYPCRFLRHLESRGHKKLLHQELAGQSGIAKIFILWIFFYWLCSAPLIKFNFMMNKISTWKELSIEI